MSPSKRRRAHAAAQRHKRRIDRFGRFKSKHDTITHYEIPRDEPKPADDERPTL